MRIGYEGKKAAINLTGIGNYSRRCVNSMVACGHQVMLFVPSRRRKEAISQINSGVELIEPPRYLRHGLLYELWRIWLSCSDIQHRNAEIFHGLSNELPFGISRCKKCRKVVTIHDLIFLTHPETYKRSARIILKKKTRYACRVADKVVTISQRTKEDLISYYGIEAEKITVIYQSISPVYFQPVLPAQIASVREKHQLPEKYVLCVATLERRKNQECLVRAMRHLDTTIHLVLAGKPTPYQDYLVQLAKEQQVDHRVHILNHIPAEDLPAIYHGAHLFAYMSLYEGFGLPVAEALACGIPVVAATGSCLEEAGGPHSIYIGPNDHESLAKELTRISQDPSLYSQMSINGKAYAQQFNDESMGASLLALYQKLLS